LLPKALGQLELAIVTATIVDALPFAIRDLSLGHLVGFLARPVRRRPHLRPLLAGSSAFRILTVVFGRRSIGAEMRAVQA
jgi:hypothetical protein